MDDKDCFGIIYKVTNLVNGKVYIGQTTRSLYKRMWEHKSRALNNVGNWAFCKAITKYGFDNFKFDVLEKCYSKEELDEMEFHYIKQYDTLTKKGYNCTLGGEGNVGFKHNKRTIELIRRLKTGVKLSEDSIKQRTEKQSYMWEITYPDGKVEVIKNLSEFCKNNHLNATIMLAVSKGDRNHNFGFKCKKLSKRSKALSEKSRNKISVSNTGRKLSKESIAKRTEAQSGVWEILYKDTGYKILVKNLKSWCAKNNIRYSSMTRVSLGKRNHHKGMVCRKLSYEELYNIRSGDL